MGKKLAVVQSSYIPWKGYFDLIHAVDEFVLFDDVQYTRRDWRNRNLIKTRGGPVWLTIPVNAKGNYLAAIKDVTVNDPEWPARHWKTICGAYRKAPHFEAHEELFARLYAESTDASLSAINRRFIDAICGLLGIGTRISWSMDYSLAPGRTERLVQLCQDIGADCYISGPSARAYIEPELFRRGGIELVFFDYAGYREYEQLHPPFDHHVSILDLLFHVGSDAPRYMLTF